jgi:four helix bundle protein
MTSAALLASSCWVLQLQLAANYREAIRASTKKHFTAILVTALREADETLYWLEWLGESKTVKPELLNDLTNECRQLVAILAASVKTARVS